MKLEKYEDKSKKKRKVILISLGVIVLISVLLLLYKTFASFTESAEFQMMNGQVDYFGNSDIYFAFYKGDEELEEMPGKDNEENLVFDYGECDNGASIIWNENEWAPLVKGLNKVKTKCSLYFKKSFEKELVKCGQSGISATECIKNNANLDTTNLTYDNASANGILDNNLRYVGATPNNYVEFNKEKWRIIGVMNNIIEVSEDEKHEQTKKSLIKLIKDESIGAYGWDTSSQEINNGYGINEWSQADIQKVLNYNYLLKQPGGTCYSGIDNLEIDCPNWENIGINDDSRQMIDNVIYNLGTYEYSENFLEKITADFLYKAERSSNNGKQCTNIFKNLCSDNEPRYTTWIGKIGLMYPSDYGYAVGNNLKDECLNRSTNNYKESCSTDNWFVKDAWTWTITPVAHKTHACRSFILSNGNIYDTDVLNGGEEQNSAIQPVLYLKSNVKIVDGKGTEDSPYILEM